MATRPHDQPDPEADSAELLRGVEKLDFCLDLSSRREKSGDLDGSIRVLKRGINESSMQGRLNHTLQFFGHLRRYYLEDVRYRDLKRDVLWFYKWIAEAVIQYAEVPLASVDALFEQMEQFYVSEESPLRPVWKLRCVAAMYTGQPQAEQEWFARWDAEPRTDADDCEACEWGFRAERLILNKQDAEALAIASPITNARNWCGATPEIASLLIGSSIRCKQMGLARWLCHVSARSVRTQGSLLGSLGYHIVFRALVGEIDRSRRLAIVGLLRVADSRNDRRNTIFYRQLAYWAAITTLQSGGKFTLPAKLFDPAAPAGAALPVTEIVARSVALARGHSQALDLRNGTTLYADKVDELDRGIREMFST